MNVKIDFPTVILVGLVAFMMLGAALMIPLNGNEFKSEVSTDSASIYVDMRASVFSDYSVLAVDLDNTAERELLVYYDESYASPVGHSGESTGIQKLASQLKYLNVKYTTIDAEELKTLMTDTANAQTKSVAVFSGAFPCNVYASDGSTITLDLVKPWMEAGGIVYWQSDERFGYYSAPLEEEFTDWKTGQPLDVGAAEFGLSFQGDVNGSASIGGNIRSQVSTLLNVEQSLVKNYAVVGTASVVNFGFETEDGRYSIAYAEYGSGGAVIMGGDFTPEISMAKIIASRVCDWADYDPVVQTGQFKGNCSLTFDKTNVDAVYVYMGTLTPRYGELFLL